MPPETPVTTPVVELTVAIPADPVLQVPPVKLIPCVKVIVPPVHKLAPVIKVYGFKSPVNVLVVLQPVLRVYRITPVPYPKQVTTPEEDPTEAIPKSKVLHTPPPDASLSVVVAPIHLVMLPVMDAGIGFTVNVAVDTQPLPTL